MNDLESFAKLVQALHAWRGHLIFVGGWAHRLHTMHAEASKLEFQPVFTKDVDLALNRPPPEHGSIKDALIEHGFTEQFSGEAKPPATHYVLGNETSGFYAEFLTPLVGSGYKRGGVPDATALVSGISAHKIAHLGLLMIDPWVVTIGEDTGVPLAAPVDLQVVNPLCFMLQKFLILEDRQKKKRRQDLLYVHDTLMLFGEKLEVFQKNWQEVIKPKLEPNEVKTIEREIGKAFASLTDDILAATAIPLDRKLSPEEFRATCEYSFKLILGQ